MCSNWSVLTDPKIQNNLEGLQDQNAEKEKAEPLKAFFGWVPSAGFHFYELSWTKMHFEAWEGLHFIYLELTSCFFLEADLVFSKSHNEILRRFPLVFNL